MTKIILSFCIPIMNRLSDIQATLRKNLDDNAVDRGLIEFIVVCFDKDDETEKWIKANFGDELESGYLRFYKSNAFQKWHFGKAKNAFRNLMRGKVYASLDGDNFTGPSGGRHIIEVFQKYDYNCVFHQFQGEWGDGTCGRVSMSAKDYHDIGYDDTFLPRQWDELDALLSILVQKPLRYYVCYNGKSIAQKSQPFGRFLTENKINIQTVELNSDLDPLLHTATPVAVGQNNNNYVDDDKRLRYSSIFNHLTSFYKNTKDTDLRNQYVAELVETQRTMADELNIDLLLNWFLMPTTSAVPSPKQNDIVLLSCIKNEPHLDEWLAHYRSLGVTYFFIIDDGSKIPIAESISNMDSVYIWKPICGQFRFSKAFWIEILLRKYVIGLWAMTVDSDEYLDLPSESNQDETITPLQQFIHKADSNKKDYFAGFLLDLVPGPECYPLICNGEKLPRDVFEYYQKRPGPAPKAYQKNNTVAWSYGKHSDKFYSIDIRFRLNRSFDSLRKFPLFRMNDKIHLNQGFHDLIIDGIKRKQDEMGRDDLLVVRHYKLFYAQDEYNQDQTKPLVAYHHETSKNLQSLSQNIQFILKQACVSPFTKKKEINTSCNLLD